MSDWYGTPEPPLDESFCGSCGKSRAACDCHKPRLTFNDFLSRVVTDCVNAGPGIENVNSTHKDDER